MPDTDLGRSYPAPNFGRTYPAPNLGCSYPAPNLGRDYPVPTLGRETTVAPVAIVYLLGPFQFILDVNAPIPSPYTEYLAVGSLTVTDTGNKASVSAGEVLWTSSAGNWDPGLVSPSFARIAGRTLIAQLVNLGTTGSQEAWTSSATPGTSRKHGFFISSTTGALVVDPTTALNSLFLTVVGVTYQVAVVLRSTGAYFLIRGGIFADWTLVWVDNSGTTTPLFAQFLAVGINSSRRYDNLRVLDLGTYDARFATDYGLALNRSTFTAPDGTALTAIVPEVGGAWTAAVGAYTTSGNKAIASTLSSLEAKAYVDTGVAEIVAEVTINFSVTSAIPGLIVRYTDPANFWVIEVTSIAFVLKEVNAGVVTTRATTPFTAATATDYRVVVVAEGSTITAYVNNASKITYASATLNQTVTKHGLYYGHGGGTTGLCTYDDFVIYPRTLSLPAGI